jgi:hypothetical protein
MDELIFSRGESIPKETTPDAREITSSIVAKGDSSGLL